MTSQPGPGGQAWIRYERIQPSKTERQRLQPYQWDLEKIAGGRQHWAQYVGRRGATRHDFYQKKIENDGLAILPDWAQPFAPVNGKPVKAWIEHNRWVATCECGGQEVVDPTDPVFFCWGCGNALNHGQPRPVDFDRDALDAGEILMARPMPETRSWDRNGTLLGKPEPIGFLIAENEEHGVPVQAAIKARLQKEGRA